jgi:UMF1 family MFS transporter
MKPVTEHLNPGVTQRDLVGWAMYDFANSGYATVVLTAVFSAYFVGVVAANATWATLAWTVALSLSHALVMLSLPVVSAWADRHAAKKRALAISTLGCVVCTAGLASVGAGDVAWALVLIVASQLFFAYGESLSAAFLPELAPPPSMGRVSAWGWAWGYVGGMLTLGLCLAYVFWAQARDLGAGHFVPITMLITAAVFGLASGVTFACLRERAVAQAPTHSRPSVWGGVAQWRNTWAEVSAQPAFVWLLACTVAYQAGVAVAIALAAIYAQTVMGFETTETMLMVFVLNIAAALGALVLGHGQDRFGHRRALALTLVVWCITCVWAALAADKLSFWGAATLAGLSMGASQSCGRAMVGLFAPPDRLAVYFGGWTFAVRLASVLGPLLYGLVTWGSGGNQRLALASTAGLFVLGLLLLTQVHMPALASVKRG